VKSLIKWVFIAGINICAGEVYAGLITNGSFEDEQLNGRSWQVFSDVAGWSASSGAGIEIQRNTVVAAQDGNQYVELDSHNNSSMSQFIEGLSVGQSYDLSFWYRARTNRGDNDNGINAYWGENILDQLVFEISDLLARDGGWQEFSTVVSATATTMVLSYEAVGINNSLGGFIDNISLTVPIGEPGSLALFFLGGLGLVMIRKKTAEVY